MEEGFSLDVDTALLFFRVCSLYKITNRNDRVALMRKICSRGKAKYIRDVNELVKGKKTLYVGKRSHTNDN